VFEARREEADAKESRTDTSVGTRLKGFQREVIYFEVQSSLSQILLASLRRIALLASTGKEILFFPACLADRIFDCQSRHELRTSHGARAREYFAFTKITVGPPGFES